jgi:hypothetical protein
MARSWFLSALLLAMGSLPAAAELRPEERQEVVTLAESRGHPAGDVAPLLEEIERAAAAGLPPAPLFNKVKEGLAKGVPPARVHTVLRDIAARMTTARRILGDTRAADEARAVEVLGEALGRGATPEEVAEIARLTQTAPASDPTALAFGAKCWALLKEAGIAASDGLPLVADAVRQGFRGPELMLLAREVGRRRDDFASGRASLDAIRQGVQRGERPERLFPPERGTRVERPETPERDRPEAPERTRDRTDRPARR